jgi:hypothetical protein
MINSMRGEFEASLAGEMQAFDTNLGTIAAIEDACGDASTAVCSAGAPAPGWR